VGRAKVRSDLRRIDGDAQPAICGAIGTLGDLIDDRGAILLSEQEAPDQLRPVMFGGAADRVGDGIQNEQLVRKQRISHDRPLYCTSRAFRDLHENHTRFATTCRAADWF
jgi:hypothetical protein